MTRNDIKLLVGLTLAGVVLVGAISARALHIYWHAPSESRADRLARQARARHAEIDRQAERRLEAISEANPHLTKAEAYGMALRAARLDVAEYEAHLRQRDRMRYDNARPRPGR